MTLIVGVKCEDGIVLGADSSATLGVPLGQLTIRQDTSDKLHIAHNRIVLGVSGPVALSQSYSDEIDAYLSRHGNKVHWKTVQEAKTELSGLFWKHAGVAWERARVAVGVVGQPATVECNHSTAVAFAIGNTPHLVQFSPQCQPEEVTRELPFAALGSGQPSADVFLAFIRRIFWPSEPSLGDGQLATIWTLDEVIKQIPGFVGGKIQVAVLKEDTSHNWKCSKLSEDEINTHREMIQNIENEMPKAANVTMIGPAPTPPTPPESVAEVTP